jgi:hypothetical protein
MKRRVPSLGTGRAAVCPDRVKNGKTDENKEEKTDQKAIK